MMGSSGKAISNSVKILRVASRSIPNREPFQITDNALKRFHFLLKQKPEAIGLRIGVQQRGCSGYAYDMSYCDKQNKQDLKFTKQDVTIFIDNKAQLTLIGSEIDFIEDELGSEFIFKSPSVKNLCGCGESFN